MTDLEITRLCAEAMGILTTDDVGHPFLFGEGRYYTPLHDDAQAMALFKAHPKQCLDAITAHYHNAHELNLNRVICECVANMQKAATKPQERTTV